ncbi:hypothetical protein KW799_00085 [Candidatus Parcubacteria bacterium]|nr:hypothetical protein [Candidatus Parcubacteria bacterium]
MEGTPHNQDNRIEARPSEKGLDAGIVFGHNSHFAFVYKKTEKLVTAVYMITNFIKDSEPLKWKIRESALSLMALNLDWSTVSLAERRDLLKEYQALALEIVSLSSVAHHSGLISEMNFHILSREFNSLVSVISKDENKKANEETIILDPRFFDTHDAEPLPLSEASFSAPVAPMPAAAHKGHVSRTSVPAVDESRTIRKPEYLPLKDMQPKPERALRTPESKDSRQGAIIKLLSKKSGLNIRDFAENIKGCSEKTIQRELLAMVATGVLKKEGERRWSTYSLA